jgi:uncharacterized protein
MRKVDSEFWSGGLRCAGTLYLPEGEVRPPVVLMAHGFGAERSFRLPAFAGRFVERGLAAYVFDYRNFGDSPGEPRNLVNPRRHVADWGAAIAHVRGLKEVNAGRMGLWGSSYSGGHVLVAASKYKPVSAVVSQVPFVDGLATALGFTPAFVARATWHATRDLFAAATGRPPHMVPIVGDPDEFAMMNTPDSRPGYMALVPEGSTWKNECPARAALTLLLYRPTAYAAKVDCPALVVLAEKDTLISPSSVRRAAAKLGNVEVEPFPVGHFDVYVGDWFEKVSELECGFLSRHLLGSR